MRNYKKEESAHIVEGLKGILADIDSGKLAIDMEAEDIHTFVEGELTKRIGVDGKRLHTSRSRNDQVALDNKLYLRKQLQGIKSQLEELVQVIAKKRRSTAPRLCPVIHICKGRSRLHSDITCSLMRKCS